MSYNNKIEIAAEIISNAEALVITAGAGIGVDSGLPDFRGNEGFWRAYPPYASKGLSFIDMANPGWFHSDPTFAWGFYGHRLNLYRKTIPHDGFSILLKWSKSKSDGFFVFTSNVDGQFQRAGFPEEFIEEVHGSIHWLQCSSNCGLGIISGKYYDIKIDETTMRAVSPIPKCPICGDLLRPNILMFGDWEYDGNRQSQQQYRFKKWLNKIKNKRLTVIECGAGRAVPTVRMASESLVNDFQAKLIRINVREPEVPNGQISIQRAALEVLKKIDEIIT